MTARRRAAAAVVDRDEQAVTAYARSYRPGQEGHPTARVGVTVVEVLHSDEQGPTSVRFPVEPGSATWAIVQIGQSDRSRWMIGIGLNGWVFDEYPTLEGAVAAVATPMTRKAMLARYKWDRELCELEQRLREQYDRMPPAPVGACEPGWTRRTVIPPF